MKNNTYCIANWKMCLNKRESINYIENFLKFDLSINSAQIIICPSFPSLDSISSIKQNEIEFGTQNISEYDKGAYTGEVSVSMAEELNCQWSIVGHSERRKFFGDSNDIVANKMNQIYNSSLNPILCIGETLDERQSGLTFNILEKQIDNAFSKVDFSINKNVLIAYEPVWAIGTGISADIEIIEENMNFIKNFIKKFDGKNCNICLLYGGSVDKDNALEIYSLKEVSGFLIGTSSLNPETFYSIYKQF